MRCRSHLCCAVALLLLTACGADSNTEATSAKSEPGTTAMPTSSPSAPTTAPTSSECLLTALSTFDTSALQIFFADARQLAAHGVDAEISGLDFYLHKSEYPGPTEDVDCALFVTQGRGGAVIDSAGECHGSNCGSTPLSRPGFSAMVTALVQKGALSGLVYEGHDGVVIGLGFAPGDSDASRLLVGWYDTARSWPEARVELAQAAAEHIDLDLKELVVDAIPNGAIGQWESILITASTTFGLAERASSLTNPIHAD